MQIVLAALAGYLCGSIPFGLLLTRAAGLGDLRQIGSGNIGATNVLRTGNKALAAATLLLDALKGGAAVLLGYWLCNRSGQDGSAVTAGVIGGVAALVGHCYPIWLKFRGGKGVATMLGVAFAFDWRIGVASALVWVTVALVTRISSAGGISAVLAAPAAAFVLFAREPGDSLTGFLGRVVFEDFGIALLAMAIIVLWRHRANIRRLANGTEPKIGGGAQ